MLRTNRKQPKHLDDQQIFEFVALGLKHYDLNAKGLDGESQFTYGATLAANLAATMCCGIYFMTHLDMNNEQREKFTFQCQKEANSLIHDWISLKLNKKEILV